MESTENNRCPVCMGDRTSACWSVGAMPFRRCAACRAVYSASSPDARGLAELYNRDYHRARGHGEEELGVAPAKRRTFGEFLRCLPPPTPPARLLEVGCAAGDAVRVAADLGYTPLGVDPGRDAIARARRRFPDLEFREGGLDDAVGRDERFVAIAMFDVIEHIPEPHAFADALTARLAPGGRLLVVTPNAASLSARALGGRWFHAFTEHVVLYSAAALDRLFLSRGLRRERLEFAWKWVSAEMLRRHALVHPHIAGGGLIAGALGALPAGWRARLFPFNIGELLAVYRRDP